MSLFAYAVQLFIGCVLVLTGITAFTFAWLLAAEKLRRILARRRAVRFAQHVRTWTRASNAQNRAKDGA